MPSIVCAICLAKFTADDEIYTTQCGHTFHESCEREWRANGPHCPICRFQNPTSHKIFLSFETTSVDVELRDLQLQYNQKLTEVHALRTEIQTSLVLAHKIEQRLQQRNSYIRSLEKAIKYMMDVEVVHAEELARSIELISKLEHEVQVINKISRSLSPEWFSVTRLIIGGISRRYRKDNLTHLVIDLGKRIGVPLQKADICSVNVLGTNYKAIPQQRDKFNLLVAMRTPHLAQSFILQKFLLFTTDEFHQLLIKEYVKSSKKPDERLIVGGLSNALRLLDITAFLVTFAAKLNVPIAKTDIESVQIVEDYQPGNGYVFDDEHTLVLCVRLISVELSCLLLGKKKEIPRLEGFAKVFVRRCPCSLNAVLGETEIVRGSPMGDMVVSPSKRLAVVGLADDYRKCPLVRVILDMAQAMRIELNASDILSVDLFSDKHPACRLGKVNLLVEFYRLENAAWFFLGQQCLVDSVAFQGVSVKLHKIHRPHSNVHRTLEYAKSELKPLGYSALYVIDGLVYAQKQNSIPIYKLANCEDVDMLVCDQFERSFVGGASKMTEFFRNVMEY